MHLNLTDEQQMIQDTAREFLRDSCPLDKVREWEKLPEGYPTHMWDKMAEMGWTGIIFPEEYGGMGLKNLDAALLMREMGRVALSSPFLSTVLLAGRAILTAGSEEQKQATLPEIASGNLLVSFAFQEASCRPDAATVKTTARADGKGWVLNGTKHFVEFAEHAGKILVVARTTESADPKQGLTMFLVDAKAPGIKYSTLQIMALQPQANVTFENVRVGPSDVVGEIDHAWPVVDSVTQSATAALCSYMTGIAEGAHELALAYSKERVQFGQPIGAFQAIQGYLAMAWAKNVMGEYLGYYAAWLIDNGIPSRQAVSEAKGFVGYATVECTQLATQLFGGMGATADARTTPFLKWAKQLQQTLGNCQYHEKVIAEEILDHEPLHLDVKYSMALH